MKKRTLLLAVLAVLLVLSSGIGSAIAYFTAYANARGGYVIRLGNWTEIQEDYLNGHKHVQIVNTADKTTDAGKYPVFVRALAFSDSGLELTYSSDPAGVWAQRGENDSHWYYQKALYAGETSDILDIAVAAEKDGTFKPGDTADVIVVYESVPAVFNADGSPDLDTAWATDDIKIIDS